MISLQTYSFHSRPTFESGSSLSPTAHTKTLGINLDWVLSHTFQSMCKSYWMQLQNTSRTPPFSPAPLLPP